MASVYDERALLAAVQNKLKAVTWNDATKIFNADVFVSALSVAELISQKGLPLATIRSRGGAADEDQPRLKEKTIVVTIAVNDRSDSTGEAAIMGAANEHGLMQAASRVERAIDALLKEDGVAIYYRNADDGEAQVDGMGMVAYREIRYSAHVADISGDD